jgi:hypothetical protein
MAVSDSVRGSYEVVRAPSNRSESLRSLKVYEVPPRNTPCVLRAQKKRAGACSAWKLKRQNEPNAPKGAAVRARAKGP